MSNVEKLYVWTEEGWVRLKSRKTGRKREGEMKPKTKEEFTKERK